jgi:hypothetical protein
MVAALMLALLLLLLFGFFLISPKVAAANTALVFYVEDISKTKPFDFSKVPTPTRVYLDSTPVRKTPAVRTSVKLKSNQAVTKVVQNGYSPCSCVSYSKAKTGFSKSIGLARNWPTNSSVPVAGGVVVTWESRAGHVGYILAVTTTTITITEANYSHCKLTTRTLNINDKRIKGFWSPN